MPLADGRALVSPVFVARDAAFDAFARVFDQVEEGRGQTVLLSGEAGVGKSRFVSEARAHAERAGSRFLEGNCFEPDRSLPFAPLVDALNTTMLPRTRATTLPILGPYAPELVKILPELGLWLPDARPTAPLDPQQEKRRVFRALVSFLLDLANDAPLLFTVEDVHWCDDTSLDFLRFLALHGRSSRLLVLLTARLDEPSPSLVGLVSELNRQRALVELSLRPLAPGEVSVMVGAIFSLERPPRPEFIDTLHSLTEGNPFFIEEVLRSLVESGSVAPADRGWARRALAELTIPRSIDDAVQLRIGLLGRRDRDTLALAAVAGRRIDLALLEALTGESEAELLATMETLVGAQLLVDFGDRFAFRHALTQQAVSARLPARRRKALHRMIGETIERLYASSLDKHLSELAYHFHQAEQWPQTLAYSRIRPRSCSGGDRRIISSATSKRPSAITSRRWTGRAGVRTGWRSGEPPSRSVNYGPTVTTHERATCSGTQSSWPAS
jgi:predicted ATPase